MTITPPSLTLKIGEEKLNIPIEDIEEVDHDSSVQLFYLNSRETAYIVYRGINQPKDNPYPGTKQSYFDYNSKRIEIITVQPPRHIQRKSRKIKGFLLQTKNHRYNTMLLYPTLPNRKP